MNSQLWKSVFDNLDEDIVNSAAERFGKVKYSAENPESYPADDKPTVYNSPARRGKSSRRYFIAIGSAAAAAVAGIFILRNSWGILNTAQPLSSGVGTAEASTEPDTPVNYVESQPNHRADISEKLKVGGFNTQLFEAYFYGSWTDGGGSVLNFDYSPNEMFSHYGGRTVVRMANNPEGGFMLASGDYGYDLFYVPGENPDILYYYQNIALSESELTENLWDMITSDRNFTGVYTFEGALTDSNRLGYFGIEKLAEEMGVTAEWLLNQDIQFEGGDAELWTRKGTVFSVITDWDNVVLLDQSENSVTLCMVYMSSSVEEFKSPQYFDVTFERNGGSWEMTTVQSGKYYFGAEELYDGLTKEGITLFLQYFYGNWSAEWNKTEKDTENLLLLVDGDIFTPTEPCIGVAEAAGGWAMCHMTTHGINVYYIPQDDTDTMYLYVPDENGFAVKDNYTAVYERNELGKTFESSVLYYSWMSLERYKFMHDEKSDGISLAEVIDDALNDCAADNNWSASFYTSDMEGWDGYRIVELSDSFVLFSFQQFTTAGESRWVTQELVKQGADWTLGELTDGVLIDEDNTDSIIGMEYITTDAVFDGEEVVVAGEEVVGAVEYDENVGEYDGR